MPDHRKDTPKREAIADRTPFHVRDADLDRWIKKEFPLSDAEEAAVLRRALKRKGTELRQRFEKAGWQFSD